MSTQSLINSARVTFINLAILHKAGHLVGLSHTVLMQVVNAKIDDMFTVFGLHTDHECGVRKQDWWLDMKDELEAMGLKFLGAGNFAATFKTPNGLALKIGFKRDDSGAAYAAYCRANPSKYVSEILAIERYTNCYMVMMPCYEEYTAINHKHKQADDYNITFKLLSLYLACHGVFYKYDNTKKIEAMPIMENSVNKGFISLKNVAAVKEFLTDEGSHFTNEMDELIKVCEEIRTYFTGIASFDLHDENIMLVKDETTSSGYRLILTDPMSWTKDKADAFGKDAPKEEPKGKSSGQ
jgi:hypothetical protein